MDRIQKKFIMNTNLIDRNNNSIYEINVQLFIEIINKKVKELLQINDFRDNTFLQIINHKLMIKDDDKYLEKYF